MSVQTVSVAILEVCTAVACWRSAFLYSCIACRQGVAYRNPIFLNRLFLIKGNQRQSGAKQNIKDRCNLVSVTMKPLRYLAFPLFFLLVQADLCATRQKDPLESSRMFIANETNITKKPISRCLSACDNPVSFTPMIVFSSNSI